jgi:transcriptional regulator with XRE-family HTH domain
MSLTPAQCRAARGLLDWSQAKLAGAAKVGLSTVKGFEGGRSMPVRHNLAAIRAALEAAGVIFVEENAEGPGVRLRKGGAAGARAASIPIEDLNAENDE